jgi:sigma-E factor negative regulatory protein RseA
MDEKFSSFLDGELDEAELDTLLARIKQRGDLRRAWETYNLIGDALRGQLSNEVVSRVASRLADEPAVIGRPRPQHSGGARKFLWPAMSAAAGVAAVVIVAFVALPGAQNEPQLAAVVPQTILQAAPATGGKLDRYLLAHQRFSSSSTMQGVAPYVRTVSEGRDGSPK